MPKRVILSAKWSFERSLLLALCSVPPITSEGYISLTFDDGYQCQYDKALPLLEEYGIHATFYVTVNFLEKPGYLTNEQVIELSQKGHEIASHTLSHRNLKTLSPAEVQKELYESQYFLEQWIQAPVKHFAPPFGAYNSLTNCLVKQFYHSSRTIIAGLNDPKRFSPFFIRAYVVFNDTPLKKLEEWIDRAIKENKWLVLVYHQIEDGNNAITISPHFFEENLKVIRKRKISIKTIGEFLPESLP